MGRLYLLIGIILVAIASVWVIWPQKPSNYLPGVIPWPEREPIQISLFGLNIERRGMTLGLDLQGGTQLVLEADLAKAEGRSPDEAMNGVLQILERRVNAYGVTEPVLSRQGQARILVQLPGVRNIQEAKDLIGKTAQLDFREQGSPDGAVTDTVTWIPAQAPGLDGQMKTLTGAYLKGNSAVTFDQGRPQITFEFNDEGAKLFEQITTRLVGKPLGIFLDSELISAPTVQDVIRARGVITGPPLAEARLLAIQLNAGALPVPIHIVQEQDVDATLGADSIHKSLLAGEIGLAVVLLFMLLHYRFPGLLAGLALLIYAALVLAIFKLVPVTLTLAGIAAFILSVGMAVDANILIFERMKEEVRRGRTLTAAVEAGFGRAWPSIRDSNISTLITCAILYWFGSNFGASLVMGFALTLFIGVITSMFTAIIVTRTFLRLAMGWSLLRRPALLGV